MFLIRPPAITRVAGTIGRFIDAAVTAGIDHVVFVSDAGAETNRLVPHHRIEQHLFGSGIRWTILRPGFFAQNLGDAYRSDIREGRLHVLAGDGRVAFIDVRDVGDLAAAILTDPSGHTGLAYTSTGPAAVTFSDVARTLSHELGRAITYEPATAIGYLRHLRRRGLPVAPSLVQTVLHLGLRRGDAEVVRPDLERLLGRPARSLTTYVRDHRQLWDPAPRADGA